MTRLIRAEIAKLATVRSTWLVFALVAAFSGATVAGMALLSENMGPDALAQSSVQLEMLLPAEISLFALLLGTVIATSEFRHGTIVTSALGSPSRWRLLPAKAVAAALAGVAMTIVAVAVNSAVGLPWLAALGETLAFEWTQMATLAGLAGMNAALVAVLGVGVGALLRNQVAAIVAVIVVTMVVSPLLLGLAPDIGWYTPAGLENILTSGSGILEAVGLEAPIGAWAAAGLMGAYAAGALALGGAALVKRDV